MKKIKDSTHTLTFIYLLMIGGFLTGILLSQIADLKTVEGLDVLLSTVDATKEQHAYFVSQFLVGILFVIFICFLGTSILGIPIIAFILFTRGVQIGFSCAMFVYTYQLKGILGILLALFPQVILDIISILVISAYSIECSKQLLFCILNKNRLNAAKLINQALNCLIFAFIIVLISAYLKSTLILKLIQLFNLI